MSCYVEYEGRRFIRNEDYLRSDEADFGTFLLGADRLNAYLGRDVHLWPSDRRHPGKADFKSGKYAYWLNILFAGSDIEIPALYTQDGDDGYGFFCYPGAGAVERCRKAI